MLFEHRFKLGNYNNGLRVICMKADHFADAFVRECVALSHAFVTTLLRSKVYS